MKMTIRTFTACLVAITLLTAAPLALAQPAQGSGPEGAGECSRGGARAGFLEQLDLTDEQKERMKEQRKANREKMKELMGSLRNERNALRDELKKPDASMDSVAGTVAKMKTVQSEMIDQRVNGFLTMKEILTPEQFQKLLELKEQRKHRGGKRRMEKKHHMRGDWD